MMKVLPFVPLRQRLDADLVPGPDETVGFRVGDEHPELRSTGTADGLFYLAGGLLWGFRTRPEHLISAFKPRVRTR
jgi:hypothetical protein